MTITDSVETKEPIRLFSLSELSRIVNLDMRTLRRKLEKAGVYPDAIAGNTSRPFSLYQIERVSQGINGTL